MARVTGDNGVGWRDLRPHHHLRASANHFSLRWDLKPMLHGVSLRREAMILIRKDSCATIALSIQMRKWTRFVATVVATQHEL